MGRGRRPPPARVLIRRQDLAAVAAGGALGTLARYGVARLLPVGDGAFPWATFLTNVSGSFALGVVVALVAPRLRLGWVRPFLAVGFLGAYTTWSTFAVEVDMLVRDGAVAVAAGYATASVAAGLAAARAGLAVGR